MCTDDHGAGRVDHFCEVGPQWFWGVGFGIFSVEGTSVGERWSGERVGCTCFVA